MKKQTTWMAAWVAGLCLVGATAQATVYNYSFNSGTTVADGNATGWSDSHTITDITGNDQIVDLNVQLNLSGGYNGDLYGYLVLSDPVTHTATAFSVLLNQVGTGIGSGPSSVFGYSDAGLNIVLSDSGANGNIHSYQNVGGYNSLITSGGAFQTDGGSLATFNGAAANGTWTLFLADMSTGGVTQVDSWGLQISVVPEPVTWAVMIFGAAGAVLWFVRRQRTANPVV